MTIAKINIYLFANKKYEEKKRQQTKNSLKRLISAF